MSIIGKVDSLWRYPVKSMRGEELDEIFAGFSGIYGDRLFAFKSSASRKGFPYFTAREQTKLAARGRHDPCVLPRAVPMVEAMAALVLCDHALRQRAIRSSKE